MSGEILLDKQPNMVPDEDQRWFGNLEEKVLQLLEKFLELKREGERLAVVLKEEKEKVNQLEKKVRILSHDREKVRTRIDQLLHRFKGVDT
jgi:chromosome segregation ATPase